MPDDAGVANRVIVNLLLVAIGYLIKRVGLVSRDEGRVLNRIVLYVTLPAMNLKVISATELSWGLAVLPLLSLATGILASQVGRWRGRALDLSRQDLGTFVVSLCGVMGSLAYPFAEAAFGDEGVRTVAVSDLGNAVAIFAFAYYLSFRYASNGNFSLRQVVQKVAAFFPLHAFLLAIALNLSGTELGGLPGGVVEALASMNSPLMLLGLGIYLEIDVSRQESRILLSQLVSKYAVGALVAAFVLLVLPLKGPTRAVTFLLPLMPTSLSTLLYSVEQDLNPRLAAMLISLTMVISIAITTVTVLGFRHSF
ncbi:MAG: AEC family transporter [Anaerolineae bacterium]